MNSEENNVIKIHIATEIYNGINNIDVNLNIIYTSKSMELLPLFSKLREFKDFENVTIQQIALSLRDYEIKALSEIQNLKEKTRICSELRRNKT